MPRYERQCRACGNSFDVNCSVSQIGSIACPACASQDLDIGLGQLRSVATHSKELHGTRRRMYDIVVNPKEVGEVRRLFQGVNGTITDDGKVFLDTKEDKKRWYKREQEIHAKAQEAHAANDERVKRGEPIKPVVPDRKKRKRAGKSAR